MMANNYESLKTDGHYTLARRIFTKIKGWIQGKNYVTNSFLSVMAPMVGVPNFFTLGILHDDGTDSDLMTFQEGENIAFTYIYSSGNVTGVTFSSDQIEDSYNYQQYQNLPRSTKMKDKLFIVDDAPDLDPAILNLVYPVGTYYETSDTAFDPNTAWGGTWILEDEGLVHISSGTNYVVSANAQDGGSAQITYTPSGTNSGGAVQGHKLITSEMPSHIHGFQMAGTRLDSSGNGQLRMQSNVNAGSGNFWVVGLARTGSGNYDGSMTTAGGDGTHNHDFTNPTFTGTQATLDNMQPYKIVNRWHRTA